MSSDGTKALAGFGISHWSLTSPPPNSSLKDPAAMPSGFRIAFPIVVFCFVFSPASLPAQIRDKAVVSLAFDDLPDTAAVTTADNGKGGKLPDVISLAAGPSRIPSAFVTGSTGYSLMLDATRQQHIVIPDSEDVSRPDAVTISGFFASLHSLDDTVYHGLFAKRKAGGGDISNFGINFQPSSDNFQIYVNDSTGYKLAHYSVKAVLGYRRRIHLTLCIDQADAAGADADVDVDDVRIRLLINGVPVAPARATGGFVEGNVGWLQDVALSKCVSDTPVTVGASYPTGEYMRLICDEFHMFASALSDEEAKALFAEVAGSSAAEISAEQNGAAEAAMQTPQIVRVAPHSAEVGKATRMIIAGSNLENARLHTDVRGITVAVAEGGNAVQAVFDVAVEDSVVPGRYLVHCVTPSGVSNPAVISVDRVPTLGESVFTEANPATAFPVASSGLISGAEQKRLWFKGSANQKIVAEVEARRIGSKLDPVVEIRTQAGTPLAIQWQQSDLNGDARASVVLPADGLYFAEVHDLQFRSPGASPWRLILGDLPPASIAFPSTIAAAATSVRTVGANVVSEAVSIKTSAGQIAIESGGTLLPLPHLQVDAGTQVIEPIEGTYPATPIDATFTVSPFPALLISGRIAAPKEQDSVLLTVTPGQTLHFAVAAKQLSSPLRAHLSLFNGDAVVAQNDGESGAADPLFSFAVPEKVTQLKVQIRDVNNSGSAASTYRLLVARIDRQAFLLTTRDGALRLPLNGSVPMRLSVVRQSASFKYTGPIRLAVKGVPGITIVPETISASEQNQQVLVMVTRSSLADSNVIAAGQSLMIEAKAEGAEPVFATTATVEVDNVPANSLTLPDTAVIAGPADSVPATILLDAVPPVLFRGLPSTVSVRVLPLAEHLAPFVRFEMITTEPSRREDPNKPDSPLKPSVGLEEFQIGLVTQGVFLLTVRVPLDTPSSTVDTVISADFVSQPLAAASGSKSWTAPMVLFVEDAVSIQTSTEPVQGAKATSVNVTGTIRRHPLFTESVNVVVDGLPQGYAAVPILVAADQSTFTVPVTIPETATAGEVPNLSLRVQHANGSVISKPLAIKLIVQ